MHDQISRPLNALADPIRRGIIARLALGEATVAELSKPFQISQPSISRHLKVLEDAGLIESGRNAQTRPRRLRQDGLREVAAWLDGLRSLWTDSFDRLEEHLNSIHTDKQEEEL